MEADSNLFKELNKSHQRLSTAWDKILSTALEKAKRVSTNGLPTSLGKASLMLPLLVALQKAWSTSPLLLAVWKSLPLPLQNAQERNFRPGRSGSANNLGRMGAVVSANSPLARAVSQIRRQPIGRSSGAVFPNLMSTIEIDRFNGPSPEPRPTPTPEGMSAMRPYDPLTSNADHAAHAALSASNPEGAQGRPAKQGWKQVYHRVLIHPCQSTVYLG